MAITIHSSPATYTPSDNPIVWTFSSNQTAQANFSYVVEIYVNGVLDSRREIFPEVGARAHIDISEVMVYSTTPATVGQTTVVDDAANNIPCYIVINERYGTPPAYQASETSSVVRAFKASITNEEMDAWNPADYTVGSSASKFMTDRPNDLYIPMDKDYFLTIITNQAVGITLVFKLYEEDGTPIPGADVAISDSWEMAQFNIRSSYLVAETIIPQSSFDAAAYMEVYIEEGGANIYSETKRYYFDREECGTHAHLVWLNRFGAFDVFNSTHNIIQSSDVQTFSYEKQFGEWQGTSYVLDSTRSGEVDYLKSTKDKLAVVTGFLNEDAQNYLTGVYDSPMVYISGSTFKRVSTRQTAYTLQNDLYEEEFTQVIELSLPNARKSVRL